MTRIAVGGFLHETNTFAPTKATYADFCAAALAATARGELPRVMRGINIGMAGFVGGGGAGWALAPILWCAASPSRTSARTLRADRPRKSSAASPPPARSTAVYLDLHGAMVDRASRRRRGRIAARACAGRSATRCRSWSASTCTPTSRRRWSNMADALIAYRTYPHIDMADTGRAAARHLARLLPRPARLRQGVPAIAVPDPDQLAMHRRRALRRSSTRALAALESEQVPTLSFAPGFPAADFPIAGPSVIAYGRSQAGCRRRGGSIAALIERQRGRFRRPRLLAPTRASPRDGDRRRPRASRS